MVVVRHSQPPGEGLRQLPGNVRESECHSPMPGVSEVGQLLYLLDR